VLQLMQAFQSAEYVELQTDGTCQPNGTMLYCLDLHQFRYNCMPCIATLMAFATLDTPIQCQP
jgi:hypothetical protein